MEILVAVGLSPLILASIHHHEPFMPVSIDDDNNLSNMPWAIYWQRMTLRQACEGDLILCRLWSALVDILFKIWVNSYPMISLAEMHPFVSCYQVILALMTISAGALAVVLSVVDRMDFRNEVYYQARRLIPVCKLQFHITLYSMVPTQMASDTEYVSIWWRHNIGQHGGWRHKVQSQQRSWFWPNSQGKCQPQQQNG